MKRLLACIVLGCSSVGFASTAHAQASYATLTVDTQVLTASGEAPGEAVAVGGAFVWTVMVCDNSAAGASGVVVATNPSPNQTLAANTYSLGDLAPFTCTTLSLPSVITAAGNATLSPVAYANNAGASFGNQSLTVTSPGAYAQFL